MTVIDIERLIKDAKAGDLQATRVLHERARRLQDPELFDMLTGIRKNKIANLRAELAQWEHFVTGSFLAIRVLGFGNKKIQAIKEVRRVSALGLREAKYVVDLCPMTIPKKFVDLMETQRTVDEMHKGCADMRLEIVSWPEDYETTFNTSMNKYFASRR